MSPISPDAVVQIKPEAGASPTFSFGMWPPPTGTGAQSGRRPAATAPIRNEGDATLAAGLRAGLDARLAALAPTKRAQILFQAFGTKVDHLDLSRVSTPRVVVVPQETLGQAHGAYSGAGGGTIYLSAAANADPRLQAEIFTEEFGHHLDAQLGSDAMGDEGAIFRLGLERGAPLGAQELATLRAEDDHGTITVGGEAVAVEFYEPSGTSGNSRGSSSSSSSSSYGGSGHSYGGSVSPSSPSSSYGGSGHSYGGSVSSSSPSRGSSSTSQSSSGYGSSGSSYGGSTSSRSSSSRSSPSSSYGGSGHSYGGSVSPSSPSRSSYDRSDDNDHDRSSSHSYGGSTASGRSSQASGATRTGSSGDGTRGSATHHGSASASRSSSSYGSASRSTASHISDDDESHRSYGTSSSRSKSPSKPASHHGGPGHSYGGSVHGGSSSPSKSSPSKPASHHGGPGHSYGGSVHGSPSPSRGSSPSKARSSGSFGYGGQGHSYGGSVHARTTPAQSRPAAKSAHSAISRSSSPGALSLDPRSNAARDYPFHPASTEMRRGNMVTGGASHARTQPAQSQARSGGFLSGFRNGAWNGVVGTGQAFAAVGRFGWGLATDPEVRAQTGHAVSRGWDVTRDYTGKAVHHPGMVVDDVRGAAIDGYRRADSFVRTADAEAWGNLAGGLAFDGATALATAGVGAAALRGVRGARAVGSMVPERVGATAGPRLVVPEGVVYARRDLNGTIAPYGGQAKSEARYIQRQTEHARAHPDADFEFTIVERAHPGINLDVAEHRFIQSMTGGVRASQSPAVSNLKDPVGPARRAGLGLPEPHER